MGSSTRSSSTNRDVGIDEEVKVAAISPLGALSEDEILRLAASVERQLSTPLALAIVKSAEERGLVLADAEAFSSDAGRGATAITKAQRVAVGNQLLMTAERLKFGRSTTRQERRSSLRIAGWHSGYLRSDETDNIGCASNFTTGGLTVDNRMDRQRRRVATRHIRSRSQVLPESKGRKTWSSDLARGSYRCDGRR